MTSRRITPKLLEISRGARNLVADQIGAEPVQKHSVFRSASTLFMTQFTLASPDFWWKFTAWKVMCSTNLPPTRFPLGKTPNPAWVLVIFNLQEVTSKLNWLCDICLHTSLCIISVYTTIVITSYRLQINDIILLRPNFRVWVIFQTIPGKFRDLFCFAPAVFLWPPVTNYMLLYSTLLCKKIARAPRGHKKFMPTKLILGIIQNTLEAETE